MVVYQLYHLLALLVSAWYTGIETKEAPSVQVCTMECLSNVCVQFIKLMTFIGRWKQDHTPLRHIIVA